MYYQNGNYMQDLNYYNQTPNFGYNPYMTNQNMNMRQGTQMPMHTQNLNTLYPAVHRIILPVANQVLANNNTQYLTEEALNSMVEHIYNIVEKDINLENNSNCAGQTQTSENSNHERNSGRPSTSRASEQMTHTQNSLLRDLIRIILLNEIISRRHRNQAMMMQTGMPMNQQMFM